MATDCRRLTPNHIQESPVAVGTKQRMKEGKSCPSNRDGQDATDSTGSHRVVVSHDYVFQLDIVKKGKSTDGNSPFPLVDNPQTPKPKRHSGGWMPVVYATPQLSMNRAMVGIRELYASPERPSPQPSLMQGIVRVAECAWEGNLEEEDELDEPQSSLSRDPWTTPTKARNTGSLFTPARAGRKA